MRRRSKCLYYRRTTVCFKHSHNEFDKFGVSRSSLGSLGHFKVYIVSMKKNIDIIVKFVLLTFYKVITDSFCRYGAYFANISRGSKSIDPHNATHIHVREIRQHKLDMAMCLGKF